MAATQTNRILSITAMVKDRMTVPLKAARVSLKLLKVTGVATFRAIGIAARLAGRAIKAMLGPLGLLTTALAGFGILKLLKVTVLVEDRVRQIATLIPDLGEEAIQKLSTELRAAAVESGQAFEDEFVGAYDAISAGVAPKRLLKFMKTANRLAVGGATDVGRSVDLLTGVLNAFGKNADEAERFSDALFTTVRKGKTTMAELADGIGQVATTAAAAGLSIEETGAAMAALTLPLGNTQIAATQLRAIFNSLASATEKQREKARQVGVDFSIAGLRAKGLVGFIESLTKATKGDIAALRVFIPNIRALSGFLNLSAGGAKNLIEGMELMKVNVGESARAFMEMEKSGGFALRRLRAAIADVAVEIGNELLPPLADAADLLRTFLGENKDAWADFAESAVMNIEFAGRALIEFKDLLHTLLTDDTESKTFGLAVLALADFVVKIAGTAIGLIINLLLIAVKTSFANFTTVFGILGEEAGNRFLAGLLKPILKAPTKLIRGLIVIQKSLASLPGLNKIGGPLRASLKFLGLEILDDTGPEFALALNLAEGAIDRFADRIVGKSTARLTEAEDLIGTMAQEVVANIATAMAENAGTISEAGDEISQAFMDLEIALSLLGETSPAITSFKEALKAIRTELADTGAEAKETVSDIEKMIAILEKAEEQARRNASGLGTGTGAAAAQASRNRRRRLEGGTGPSANDLEKDLRTMEDALIKMASGRERMSLEAQRDFDRTSRSLTKMLTDGELSMFTFSTAMLATVVEFNRAMMAQTGTFVEGLNASAEAAIDAMQTPFEAGFQMVQDLGSSLQSSFDQAIDSAVEGTFDLSNALEEMGKAALKIFAKIIAKQIAIKIANAFLGGFSFAGGGIPPGPLKPLPPGTRFGAFAKGGITRGPTLALLGEGRTREAIVPLPDGRTIPAIIKDDGAPEAPPIINNFTFEVMDARGVKQVIQEQAEVIRNIVAAGIQENRQFRGQVRGR